MYRKFYKFRTYIAQDNALLAAKIVNFLLAFRNHS